MPLSSPDIDEGDIEAVVRVLRTPRLSLGPVQEEFEAEFARYIGVGHAAAVSSGTAGLHLALLALDIGPGDEVIVPSFTFVAAANAIRYVGAIPVFVDIDVCTLNMDPQCVERAITPRTRAMIVVHNFGQPAEMSALMELAARHNLRVVEDACEAIGAEYEGRKIGSFGDAAVFAFYPNKQMTTGEGGIVTTNSAEVAATIRSLRNHGRREGGGWFEHKQLGFNYRLSELNCALGLSQLRRIDSILTKRESVASAYNHRLKKMSGVILPSFGDPKCKTSWFVYVVRLSDEYTCAQRDAVVCRLIEQGIGCGRYFAPIHLQGAYADVPTAHVSLPVTENVSAHTLALPFFNRLTEAEIEEVCYQLLQAVHTIN